MKKLLLLSMIAVLLGACTSTKTNDGERMSRDADVEWYEQAGEAGTEYWWINLYEDSDESGE